MHTVQCISCFYLLLCSPVLLQVADFRKSFTRLCYNPKFVSEIFSSYTEPNVCACMCLCMYVQAELKEGYLRDVKVPLKRFCDYLKDKKWVAGDTVRLAVVTCASCAVELHMLLHTNCMWLSSSANLRGFQFVRDLGPPPTV